MNLQERNISNKNFFGEKADGYDKVHESLMGTKKEAIEALEKDTIKVLDLGAGTGLELIYLFEKFPNAEVTAIDITPEMLAKIKERTFKDKVSIVCGDFFEVDFGTNYDAVISTSALHHFAKEDKLRLYEKIFKCLKKDGQFISSDRFVDTKEEEERFEKYLAENFSKGIHCDTPLCIKNEYDILNQAKFKDIKFINSNISEDYKLLICKK